MPYRTHTPIEARWGAIDSHHVQRPSINPLKLILKMTETKSRLSRWRFIFICPPPPVPFLFFLPLLRLLLSLSLSFIYSFISFHLFPLLRPLFDKQPMKSIQFLPYQSHPISTISEKETRKGHQRGAGHQPDPINHIQRSDSSKPKQQNPIECCDWKRSHPPLPGYYLASTAARWKLSD